ncbi:UNVERIFIED_CONTAM: hypothetical protein FKN15_059508 [Acipenser sinensis]
MVTQLYQEKLDRECFEARERERGLRNDLNVLSHQLYLQEKVNRELRGKLEQLTNEVQHKRELVDLLQQQVKMLVEESAQKNSMLGQDLENVFLDLEQLQGTESHLKNLVEELQQENKVKTKHVNYLQAELERKTHELQESQRLHEHAISKQRKENQGSLKKLQETASQFEWFCQQQQNWICCIQRIPSVDASLLEELQAEVFKWKNLYEDLCSKVMPIMSHKHTMDSKKLPEGTLA